MFSRDQAEHVFRGLGQTAIEEMPISQAFALMVHFYETQKSITALSEDLDGDMLLFQWGSYDWGKGLHFTANLTRQLIYPVDEYDQDIWQLGLSYNFDPTPAFTALKSGEMWCPETSGASAFLETVFQTEAFKACVAETPADVEVTWEVQ